MTRPWVTVDAVPTAEGALELRRRGDDDFLITVGGRVLMTSSARRSEEALATLACAPLRGQARAAVLVGGLGMGYTLRAALDALAPDARVTVAELSPEVVRWCEGPLAALTASAVDDPRVTVAVADVARVIERAPPGGLHAIVLDLYEGPSTSTQRREDPFYGPKALRRARAALVVGGVLAVWGEDPDPAFPARLEAAGFAVTLHRPGRGGRAHIVYVGVAREAPVSRSGRSGSRRPRR